MKHFKQILIYLLLLLPLHLFAEGTKTSFELVSNTHGSPSGSQGTLVFNLYAQDIDGNNNGYILIQEKCFLDAAFKAQVISVSFSEQYFPSLDYNYTQDFDHASGRIRFIYSYKYPPAGAKTLITKQKIVKVTVVYTLLDTSGAISLGGVTDSPESRYKYHNAYYTEGQITNRSISSGLQSIALAGKPIVNTNSITDFQGTSLTCGGEVTNDCASTVTAYGVCWNTSVNPTIDDNKTIDGSGTGAFTSSVTGLTEGTIYYIRAYATNSYGTSYGSEVITLSNSPGTTLNFDGSNDYVNIPDNNALDFTNGGTYTIEAWIKIETFGALKGIVSKYQNSGAYGYFLRLKNSANAKGLCIDGYETADNILEANQWYHVAAVNAGGTRHLYLNGVEQNLTSVDPCNVQANNNALCIGRDFGQVVGNRYFDGSIDEVRIWNVARTEQEVHENMYKTLDNTGDGLVCYWQYNEEGGETLHDAATGYNGTLTNMDLNNVWVNSPIPVGGGTGSSSNNFTSGMTTLGNLQLTTTDPFDNSVNLVCSEIERPPNTTSGISGSNILNKYFVINAYPSGGAAGSFSVDFTFTLPAGFIQELNQTEPGDLELYKRDNNAISGWSLVTTATSATATTATFPGITSFSQFIISNIHPPVVATNAVSDVSATTAICGGDVTDEGGGAVTAKGVCWSTSENPTASLDTKTNDGSGTGSFTSSITGLSPTTTYYVRAYAINGYATSYGSQVTFTTISGKPTVTTSPVTNITTSSAESGGNVTDGGSSTVTDRGICRSTSANPTVADNPIESGSGTGPFTSSITGLAEGTVYHIRAYATNSFGTSYGDDISFITLSTSPGTALCFDGAQGYINIPDNDALDFSNNSSYTIEVWIKPESFGPLRGIVSKYQNAGTYGYFLRLKNSANAKGLCIDGWETEDNILEENQWYHVAAVNNDGTRHLYLNGVEQNLTSVDPCNVQANNDPIRIGSDFGGRFFNGKIDEVRIWNVTRTPQQIRENMHKTLDNTNDGLVAYWQFNDGGSSTSLRDVTNNKLTGELRNTSEWMSSSVPTGSGTSNSQNNFSEGTTSTLGNVQLETTEPFDASVDLVCTEINRSPNTTSGISGNVQNRYCVLKAYGIPGTFSANLTFTLPEGSISSTDQSTPSNLKLYRRESNADGEWTLLASASSSTSTTVTFEGITSFSQFIIASESSPLPVELISFTAKQEANAIRLEWKTATEVNNYGFEIERSEILSGAKNLNGKGGASLSLRASWETLGFVKGNGNSNSPKSYLYEDKNPPCGKLQYRLKQIDFDGTYEYGEVVEVTVNAPAKFELMQNYPNPFNPMTTIGYTIPSAETLHGASLQHVTLKVYDVLGREVATLVDEFQREGIYNVQLSTNNYQLTSAIYFYRLQTESFSQTKKLMLLK
ncbi:MAG: LamG-like jellyroll fold domain-containing protein [Bacteroidota bacterium]